MSVSIADPKKCRERENKPTVSFASERGTSTVQVRSDSLRFSIPPSGLRVTGRSSFALRIFLARRFPGGSYDPGSGTSRLYEWTPGGSDMPAIVVDDLRKEYGSLRAVDGLSFTVEE